jgi:lipopolysaccharide/colanic/teichoic acid biosynthesis glycosyltransferase
MYWNLGKRVLDLCIAIPMLAFSLPIILLTGFFIFLQDGESPFFTQLRPGKNAKIFRLIKLRTMNNRRDVHGNLLADVDRLTLVGKFVRKISLDELPQLVNVCLGQMSLIGPRPLLVQYLSLYNAEQARRHEVRPGITGWAQINGRNGISWKQKFDLDVWYVNHCSLMLDLKILVLTAKKVVIREGINAQGVATAEDFNGKN